MERELEIAALLAMRQDVHTLELDIEAEKKYLEELQPKLQSAAEKRKKNKMQLLTIINRLEKHVSKENKAPSLRQNERWVRAMCFIQRKQKEARIKYECSQQAYSGLISNYKKHEDILLALEDEYKKRVRCYALRSDRSEQRSPPLHEEIEKESFLQCTFSLPGMSKP